jgi:hypothetical protein
MLALDDAAMARLAIEMWFYGHDHFPFAFILNRELPSEIR